MATWPEGPRQRVGAGGGGGDSGRPRFCVAVALAGSGPARPEVAASWLEVTWRVAAKRYVKVGGVATGAGPAAARSGVPSVTCAHEALPAQRAQA